MVKAGATGEIKLNPQFMQGMVEQGRNLEELIWNHFFCRRNFLKSRNLFQGKKLPQSKLQRISEIEKFKEKLLRLQSEKSSRRNL